MFENLKKTLHQNGISIKEYAEILGISEKSAQNKLLGRTDFTYPEFKKTCTLLKAYNADYLFAEKAEDDKTA